jgi:argininosuccinate lyase
MENTGRIQKHLCRTARHILFEQCHDQRIDEELGHACDVDRAHLIMLVECRIVDRLRASQLSRAIDQLESTEFTALRKRLPTRGLFLLYEDYLIETEGAEVGGILQTARSRNDLNATVLKLRLRLPYVHLLDSALRLQAVILRRAKRYLNVVMPAYTHGQAAEPISYGHYLTGIAEALSRDLGALFDAAKDMQSCPLGACAVAGTSLPIDTARTARLLGFDSGPANSIDAVASRDLVLRLLAAASIYGLTLSRLATDLLQWTTAEFDYLQLPDELVGSSSAMPQKRNPFLLEHVQGRAALILGAFVAAAAATHSTPFTNSIAAGTEAVTPASRAMLDLTEMNVLMRLVTANARPNRAAMLHRAVGGFTSATALANRLAVEKHIDFRTAHRIVGRAVSAATESCDRTLEAVAADLLRSNGIELSLEGLDPVSVCRSNEQGGGAGHSSVLHCLERLQEEWSNRVRQKKARVKHWRDAQANLDLLVRELGECGATSG